MCSLSSLSVNLYLSANPYWPNPSPHHAGFFASTHFAPRLTLLGRSPLVIPVPCAGVGLREGYVMNGFLEGFITLLGSVTFGVMFFGQRYISKMQNITHSHSLTYWYCWSFLDIVMLLRNFQKYEVTAEGTKASPSAIRTTPIFAEPYPYSFFSVTV